MNPDLNNLIAIDLETGGTDPLLHPIVAIGACDAHGATFQRYVLPREEEPIEPEAAAVNGYDRALWMERGAVSLDVAMLAFQDWLLVSPAGRVGKPVPLAHNASFDRQFLEAAERDFNYSVTPLLSYRWECSMSLLASLMRAGLIPPGKASLDRLCALQDLPRNPVHGALEDAQACLSGYRWMLRHLRTLLHFPAPAPADADTQATP